MIYFIDGKFNPAQTNIIVKTMSLLTELLPAAYAKNITLNICNTDHDDRVDGWCDIGEDTDWEIALDPKLQGIDLFLTLAHEMKHLEQFLQKRLRAISGGYMWERKKWSFANMKENTYADRPWEKEAIEFEEKVEKYVDQIVPASYIRRTERETQTCPS